MNNQNKIAVLIDGDNADSVFIEEFLAEAGKFGRVTIKRIYADWTNNHMSKWKEKLNKFAIRPVQKFAFTSGKNSTDTALIIDAMDMLHSNLVEGYCIISSDSDYTGLAHRIREQGLFVMGIGKSYTPEAFVKACENFTYTEILQPQESKEINNPSKQEEKSDQIKLSVPKLPGLKIIGKIDLDLINPLKKSGIKPFNKKDIEMAFNMVVDVDTGLALLSRFSEALSRVNPTFDHRNFGFSSFMSFCKNLEPEYTTFLHKDGQTISLRKKE